MVRKRDTTMKIPEWQYPLYKESDKITHIVLEKLGKSQKYPKLVGSKEEIDAFLKLLILSQKMKDYRKFRDIALVEFQKKEANISTILKQSKNIQIPRGIDESWAIFLQDKRLCKLMDEFQDAKIEFIGNDEQIGEFFVRFLLTQLLQDWRGPLMAVILECLRNKIIQLSKLNSLLEIWDYTEIFRANKAYFVIIRGPLGCGKSTIAKRLAEILNAKYISIDRVLDEHNLTKDKEAGYISQRSFIKANEIITPKAKKKLRSGIPVIFEGNFYWKSQIDDLIQRLDFPHHVFTLKAPLKVCIERDRQRGKTHGEDAARAVYKKSTEFNYGTVIDISKSLDKAINDILSCFPKSFSQEQRDMIKIVEEGYERGDYTAHFRKSKKPNKMEKHFLDALIKLIPKKATVLDFGCGTGIPIDMYLVEKKLKVTGIDISQKHIALAKRNVPQGTFIKADFSKITVARQKFDAIISVYAIFHIPRAEHKALFLKMRKLLKKNGVLLITLGTSGSEYGEEENWAGAKMVWSTYSPRIYKKMIKECGFTIVESEFEGKPRNEEYHFWLLAQKKISK